MGKKKNKFYKHSKEAKLHFSSEDLRWATNEMAADWRAERLKSDRIVDIGCGIGFQSMAFAKKASRVLGVDIDAEKVDQAKRNSKKLNFRNIEFVTGDALSESVIEKAKGFQTIFLDPERDSAEDQRKISSIKPDIDLFLSEYNNITDRIAIEFPPQIKEFPEGCEREYISINGKLNRLTLYFGGLRRATVSAVVLPQRAVLDEKHVRPDLKKTNTFKSYLYEADHAVQKAELLPELCEKTGAHLLEEQKFAYFTSEDKIRSPFFRTTYRITEVCEFEKRDITNQLKKHGFGKVLIRYEVAPEEYWNERKQYEEELFGDKQAVLIKLKDKALICEKID
jgi:16S rRNA G966 N2-methylase RsmD